MWLESERMRLRAPEPEDLDFFYKMENDSSLWQYGSNISPISAFSIREYIASCNNDIYQQKQMRLMILVRMEKGERLAGMIDLYDFDALHQRAAVALAVSPDMRGQGIAGESLNLVSRYCSGYLHLNQLYACISKSNLPSLKAFGKAGFVQTAELKSWLFNMGKYEDAVIVQQLLQ